MFRQYHSISILLLCLGSGLHAQVIERDVVSAAGGSGGTATVTVDWTLGEALMERTPTSGQHLTQGFHQPLVTMPATVNPQLPLSAIRVYPNPFQVSLNLDGDDLKKAQHLELMDASGKCLLRQPIPPNAETLEVVTPELTAGTYLLKLFGTDSLLSVFTLIKN